MRAVVLDHTEGPRSSPSRKSTSRFPAPTRSSCASNTPRFNRADILQRMGVLPRPTRRHADRDPGHGVRRHGRGGRRPRQELVGRRPVMGIEAGGCYAERVVTHSRQALPIPSNRSALADAAAIAEVFLTAWDALVVQGGLTIGPLGARARRRIRRRDGGDPDRQGDRRTGRGDVFGRQGRRLPRARCRPRARTQPGGLAGGPRAAVPDGVDVVLDVIGGEEATATCRRCGSTARSCRSG